MAKVNQMAEVKPGDRVTAMTYESIEYDTPPQKVEGRLGVKHVETLDYDQYLVDGVPVDPSTVRPLEE